MAEGFKSPADALGLAAQAMELATTPAATDAGLRALCNGIAESCHEWVHRADMADFAAEIMSN